MKNFKPALTTFLILGISLFFLNGKVLKDKAENIVISPKQVLSKDSTALREEVYNWCVRNLELPANQVEAHPSAMYFPGKVDENAKHSSKTIHLSHAPPAEKLLNLVKTLNYSSPFRNTMYSTGMYAAPGEVITVKIPEYLKGKLNVQIGVHTDNLNQWVAGNQDWRRMPLIWNSFKIEKAKIKVANPFGGLIYITCDPKEEAWRGDITIENAVQAPYFEQGKTTPEEWEQMLDSGAPWGEMASENVIVTIPTSALKQVEDPAANMALWDRVIAEIMELAQLPMPFYRAQRLATDVHIGGGYMHSGYPIMISHSPEFNLVSEDIMIDPKKLIKGSGGGANWGFFHEIGHNMQNLDWVFNGTTEVTVNLFSLYVFDKVIGSREGAHSGISAGNTQKMIQEYFKEGAELDRWKKSPFLGLILFRQIQNEFGWVIFKETFKRYHSLTEDQRPKNDQEKRAVLVGFLSESVQRDLSLFFETWGIPISGDIKKKLEKYEAWMPDNFPPVTNN